MKRNASAVWQGDLKQGKGAVSTASGVLSSTQYSFATRFENGVGTNPEELLAAAHAGCFAMALSGQLGAAGLTAERIDVTATISLEKTDSGFAITESHLELKAKIQVVQYENHNERGAGAVIAAGWRPGEAAGGQGPATNKR